MHCATGNTRVKLIRKSSARELQRSMNAWFSRHSAKVEVIDIRYQSTICLVGSRIEAVDTAMIIFKPV